MTDEKILDSIRQSAENIPIPDGIAPQTMEETLRNGKKKSFSSIYKYKLAGAAAALLCLVIGIWGGTALTRSGQSDSTGTAGNDGLNMAVLATQPPETDTANSSRPAETPGPAVTPGPALPSGNAIRLAGLTPQDSYDALYDTLSDISSMNDLDSNGGSQIYDGESASGGGQGADYSATDVQTAGVDEGDLVKTNGAQICVLHNGSDGTTVKVIDAASMELISTVSVTRNPDVRVMDEMYLDDTRLTVFATGFVSDLIHYTDDACAVQTDGYTAAYVYDISDPSNITLEGQVGQSGAYLDSRKNGDYVYLFTDNHVKVPSVRDLYAHYVPSVNGAYLPADHIYIPNRGSVMNYLQITSFNVNDPANITDSKAIFSGTDTFYVSGDHIYIANYGDIHGSRSAEGSSGGVRYLAENSGDSGQDLAESSGSDKDQASNIQYGDFGVQIVSIAYENGSLTPQAAGTIDGYVYDSFSMDACNGYLRLVTSGDIDGAEAGGYIDADGASADTAPAGSSAISVYILDENMEVTGSVEDLAPGDILKYVRFLGDTGCFVTSRNREPMIFVDLSDPYDPQVLGASELTGLPEYMCLYGEDRLLCIGWLKDAKGRISGTELSMFDISDRANAAKLHTYAIDNDMYGIFNNHKAILTDPEKNLIGLAGENDCHGDAGEVNTTSTYRLFAYDDTEGFRLLLDHGLEGENNTYYNRRNVRGLYIGDTFYVSTDAQLTGFDMKNGFAQKGYVKY